MGGNSDGTGGSVRRFFRKGFDISEGLVCGILVGSRYKMDSRSSPLPLSVIKV